MLYLDKISGERLQDHWSSGSSFCLKQIVGYVRKNGSNEYRIIYVLEQKLETMQTSVGPILTIYTSKMVLKGSSMHGRVRASHHSVLSR